MTHISPAAVLAATAGIILISGCAHDSPPPPAPPAQTAQQIQADPNLPDAVKRVRLHNQADMSGPPQRHDAQPGQ